MSGERRGEPTRARWRVWSLAALLLTAMAGALIVATRETGGPAANGTGVATGVARGSTSRAGTPGASPQVPGSGTARGGPRSAGAPGTAEDAAADDVGRGAGLGTPEAHPADAESDEVVDPDAPLPPVEPGPVRPTTERGASWRRGSVGSRGVRTGGRLRVEVRVFDDGDGAPVAGAQVTLMRPEEPFTPAVPVRDGRTDGDGRVVFAHPGEGWIVVRLAGPGRVPLADDHIRVPADRSLIIDGWLRRGTPVEGRITRREDGAPVARGQVLALWDTPWKYGRAHPPSETDVAARCAVGADGTFRFDAADPRSSVRLFASAPGRVAQELFESVATDGTLRADAALAVGVGATGSVVDPRGRTPATPALVLLARVAALTRMTDESSDGSVHASDVLWELQGLWPQRGALAWTDREGRFRADGLVPGREYVAIALLDDFACSEPTPVFRAAADRDVEVPRLHLRAPRTIVVEVFDEAGHAVTGADVTFDFPLFLHTDAQPDGRYRATGAHPVRYWGRAKAPDGRSTDFECDAREEGEKRIRVVLRDGESLSGRVLDADRVPVVRAKVTIRPHERTLPPVDVMTDAEGRFHAVGLTRGRYRISIAADDHETLHARDVVIPGPEREFVFPPGLTITARLVTPEGGPPIDEVRGAWLDPTDGRWQDPWHKTIRPDADGRVEVRGLAAGAPAYALVVRPYRAVVTGPAVANARTIDLGTVTLRPRIVVRGRVVDETGHPVAGVRVSTVRSVLRPMTGIARTDTDGRFRAEFESEGTDRAHLECDGFAPTAAPLPVADGSADVVLTIRRGVAASGRVLRADGEPCAGAVRLLVPAADAAQCQAGWIPGEVWVRCDAEGRFAVRAVPGRYRVASAAGDSAPLVELTGEGEVEIRLPSDDRDR